MQIQHLVERKVVHRATEELYRAQLRMNQHIWQQFFRAGNMLPKAYDIELAWCILHAEVPSRSTDLTEGRRS